MVLVGKGVTFDTGGEIFLLLYPLVECQTDTPFNLTLLAGISIKPSANMEMMRGDMGGAAAVLSAMKAIGQLKVCIYSFEHLVPAVDLHRDEHSAARLKM